MSTVLPALLQPAAVLDRVNRLKVTNTVLQRKWGMQSGSSGDKTSLFGRRGSYDVFNDTRAVLTQTMPGAPAATSAPNPVGNVPFQIPRFHESIPLNAETLHNLRPIGGPVGQIDEGGMSYVAEQERIQKQKATNIREFLIAGMQRGSMTWTIPGPFSSPVLTYTGGSVTMNYQIPSGNKTKLNMLGAGDIIAVSWDNAAAPIVTDLFQINQAFIQLTGRGLRKAQCTSVMWGYILANTQVQAEAGTVNQVFDYITRDEDTEVFTARLKAVPWLEWEINDNGLATGSAGAFESFIEDDHVVFTVQPDSIIAEGWNCSEPISRWPGAPQGIISREDHWIAPSWNPTGYWIMSLLNFLPTLKVPAGIAYGLCKY